MPLPEVLLGREGVILSAATNPGESSRTTQPVGFHRDLRRFAIRTSASQVSVTVTATTWIASALLIAALTPPALMRFGQPLTAMAVAAFFSKLCHQRPDRVVYLFGAPTAVCLRCLGIYAGAAIGGLLRLNYKLGLSCLGAALALNIADVLTETLGFHGNMPLLRLLIGGTLGISAGMLLASKSGRGAGTCEECY